MSASAFRKIIHPLASLRLAVFIILALATVAAVGTITEARFNDSEMASKLVYQSPWMYGVMGLLIINLTAVMISRWPWKQHHTGFVLAHIGIITLLFGAWVTQKYGIDGNIAFEIGEQRDVITVKERDFMVFQLGLAGEMHSLYHEPAEFVRHPPTESKPFTISLGDESLSVVEHYPFAFRESEIWPTQTAGDGPAIRFQLENANVNLTQWLRRESERQPAQIDLGPAKIVFAAELPEPSGRNEILLASHPGSPVLDYAIYNKDRSLRKKGRVRQSETIETGWMGLKLRLLRYLEHSAENVKYIPTFAFTPATTSAARVRLAGKDYWVGLDAPLRVFLKDRAYLIVYGHRQMPLRFPLHLLEFRMGKYQGTDRASSYESEVQIPGHEKTVISMNAPLKYDGYTFYQASFEQNERGQPTVSVLSVNYDPGRWLKYLGSFLIVLGSIILFYFKRVKWFPQRS